MCGVVCIRNYYIINLIYIIGRAGASPPSLTTGARRLYIYIYIYLILYVRPFWPPGGPALRANVAGQITRASTLYFICIYTCIHMYVYTWSKLLTVKATMPAMEMTREATETPREATEAPRRPRRSPLSPTKATEIIAKTALQIPAF